MHEAESYERKSKGGHTINRYKCPACGGNQYTSADTAEWCIYCGHNELKKMEESKPEEREGLKVLTKKQLKDAARCCGGLCELCSCNKIQMAYQDCIREAAKTALVYREMLERARKALHKGISELKVHCKYFDQTPEEDVCIEMHEAIVEIDKVIGEEKDA